MRLVKIDFLFYYSRFYPERCLSGAQQLLGTALHLGIAPWHWDNVASGFHQVAADRQRAGSENAQNSPEALIAVLVLVMMR